MVPGVGVEEAEGFAPRSRIDDLIYAWQRERILWARFVETGVVDTHPPLVVLLFHLHGVGQPLGVVNLPDETHRKEFLDFFVYGLALVTIETT
jgi:hypothetical protein